MALVNVQEVRQNAHHLDKVSDSDLLSIIEDVHGAYTVELDLTPDRLKLFEKLASQHFATLGMRRADNENAAGMTKSLSVTRDLAWNQTEYGQMARLLLIAGGGEDEAGGGNDSKEIKADCWIGTGEYTNNRGFI